jgi:hypothetical protein
VLIPGRQRKAEDSPTQQEHNKIRTRAIIVLLAFNDKEVAIVVMLWAEKNEQQGVLWRATLDYVPSLQNSRKPRSTPQSESNTLP